MPAQCQAGLHVHLDGRQPSLVEAGDGGLRERGEGELGERRAAPHRQRIAEDGRRALRVTDAERLPALLGEPIESLGVEVTGSDAQPVPRGSGAEDVGVRERAPQTRHVDLDRLDRPGLRVLAPQGDRYVLGADRLVGVEHEHRQRRAELPAGHRDRAVRGAHLQRPEDSELHGTGS